MPDERRPGLALIEGALREAGFTPRGAFQAAENDGVPPVLPDAPTRTVVLAGNAGPHMWLAFEAARSAGESSLDAWSARVLRSLAEKWQAHAVFPFERPVLPFQRWAMRAEPCHPSPVGMLIHPDYGLWHGYRGALLFAHAMELPPRDERSSPCGQCRDRPCLSACPAGAFSAAGYEVSSCTSHLCAPVEPACINAGCLVRHACPVGRDYRYKSAQARFHMEAFVESHRHRPG